MSKNVDLLLIHIGDCSRLSLPGRPGQYARQVTASTKELALSPS